MHIEAMAELIGALTGQPIIDRNSTTLSKLALQLVEGDDMRWDPS
jgi:hypothetical protein